MGEVDWDWIFLCFAVIVRDSTFRTCRGSHLTYKIRTSKVGMFKRLEMDANVELSSGLRKVR